jgi:hypothetical protein
MVIAERSAVWLSLSSPDVRLMRILYCIPDLDYGGAEKQLSYLAAEMARRGHEVHIASRAGLPKTSRALLKRPRLSPTA